MRFVYAFLVLSNLSLAADRLPEGCARSIDSAEEFEALSAGTDRILAIVAKGEAAGMEIPLFGFQEGHILLALHCLPEVFVGMPAGEFNNRYVRVRIFALPSGIFTFQTDGAVYEPQTMARVWRRLQDSFGFAVLHFHPVTAKEREAALFYEEAGVPVYWGTDLETVMCGNRVEGFIPYSKGVGFGRIRIVHEDDWENFVPSRQDILVLDFLPVQFDLPVAGVISSAEQNVLGHVNMLAMREGIPNCYVAGAAEKLAAWDGRLAALSVSCKEWNLREATAEEVKEALEARRPVPLTVEPADWTYGLLPGLEDEAGKYPVSRVGAKAANLMRFYPELPPAVRVRGFAIPFRFYREFLENQWVVAARMSLWDFIQREVRKPEFQGDPDYRAFRCAQIQQLIRRGWVDPGVITRICERIREVFGSWQVPVRFRSSSNAEDSPFFSGAGLYDSTTACASDSLDSDREGPCRCEPWRAEERTVERALRKVWASFWKPHAVEERIWYGIPPEKVGMAVLVTPAFTDEEANGVAMTGSPWDPGDGKYWVTCQAGEASAVRPAPGEKVEWDLVDVSAWPAVSVRRLARSNLTGSERFVLTNAELRRLAEVLRALDTAYEGVPGIPRELVRLDVEFKLDAGRKLKIKQVRPFLIAGAEKLQRWQKVRLRLGMNPGLYVSEVFPGLTPLQARELKVAVQVKIRDLSVTVHEGVNCVTWPIQVFLGPAGEPLPVVEDATLQVSYSAKGWAFGSFEVNLSVTKSFGLESGSLRIEGGPLTVPVSVVPEEGPRVLETHMSFFVARFPDGLTLRLTDASRFPGVVFVRSVETERGSITLYEQGKGDLARLVGAEVVWEGQEEFIDDPFRLTAARSYEDMREGFLLEFSTVHGGVGGLLLEYRVGRSTPTVTALSSDLRPIGELSILSYTPPRPIAKEDRRFVRGDVDGDGGIGPADAISLLQYLFTGGKAPDCPDAADIDDDGVLSLQDAISVLRVGLRGGGLALACEKDRTPDALPPCRYSLRICR